MTNYQPRIGDAVTRTTKNGTIVKGVIAEIESCGCSYDAGWDILLLDCLSSDETTPDHPRFNDALGTVYKGDHSQIAVRVDSDVSGWLGYIAGYERRWFNTLEIQELVENGTLVEGEFE